MPNSSLSVRRSIFVAFAATALTLVLLRPMCDLWLAHAGAGAAAAPAATFTASAPLEHYGAPAVQCCASSVSDAHHIAPLQAAPGGLKPSQGLAPAALVAVLTSTAMIAQPLHWLRAPPRSPQSFYLRSARILR